MKEWSEVCSGKFIMSLDYDETLDPLIKLEIELQHSISPTLQLSEKLQSALYSHLQVVNTEFAEVSRALGAKKTTPKVELYRFGDEKFRTDVKLKWVKAS